MGEANKTVPVELAGREYLLRYDYNAICDLEEKFGKGIAAIFNETQIGYNVMRILYWAGLKWKHHGITPIEVGKLLSKEIESGKRLDDLLKPPMQALKRSKALMIGDADADTSGDEEGNG